MRIYYVAYEGSQAKPTKYGVWLRYSALGVPISCIVEKTVTSPEQGEVAKAECARIAKYLQIEYNKTQSNKLNLFNDDNHI